MQEGVYPSPLSTDLQIHPQWKFRPRQYPHFDHVVSTRPEALAKISNFQKTGTHSFLPFLEEPSSNRQFSVYLKKQKAKENNQEEPDDSINKNRPIKYASHVDTQIFSYYRYVLSLKYEELLIRESLGAFPIAYRKIPVKKDSEKGKCNIHFAKEAFDEIVRRGNCVALTFDVRKFFESLDHEHLRRKWMQVLGLTELPKDHEAVFKAVTEYHYVDKDECYEKLGLFEWNGTKRKLLECPHRLFRERKMLCDKTTFREKIVSAGLIKANNYQGADIPQGIPQGSPISDVLANLYMIDFDKTMGRLASNLGGYYRRYSDDILWICGLEHEERVKSEIAKVILEQGRATLNLHPDKTTSTRFTSVGGIMDAAGDSFSYLGFSFDGRKARYRERTISNYQRNATRSVQSFVKRAHEKHKKTGMPFKNTLNVAQIFHKVGFANRAYNQRQRMAGRDTESNFMTYHLRSMEIFNSDPASTYKLDSSQLSGYKAHIKTKIVAAAKKFDPTFSL